MEPSVEIRAIAVKSALWFKICTLKYTRKLGEHVYSGGCLPRNGRMCIWPLFMRPTSKSSKLFAYEIHNKCRCCLNRPGIQFQSLCLCDTISQLTVWHYTIRQGVYGLISDGLKFT